MHKIAKIVLTTLFVVVVLCSVAANVYFFGWLNLQNYFEQQGAKLEYTAMLKQLQSGPLSLGSGYSLILQTPPTTNKTNTSK